MEIDLRPHSATPFHLPQHQYDDLVKNTVGGWSQCQDETEWLAKIHYLRTGFELGKLDAAQFEEREERLVVSWLKKLLR